MVILGRIIVARSMVSLVGDFLSWECSLSFSYSDLRASRRGLSFGDVQATIFEGLYIWAQSMVTYQIFCDSLKIVTLLDLCFSLCLLRIKLLYISFCP